MEELLQSVVEGLEDALLVKEEAILDESRGYPFAAGYLSATIMETIQNLNVILDTLPKT
jgi:ABC-type transporter Mla subunit MlaD